MEMTWISQSIGEVVTIRDTRVICEETSYLFE